MTRPTTSAVVFPQAGLVLLRELERHNSREWFQANRAKYEASVRGPMLQVTAALVEFLAKQAPAYVGDPAKALSRPNRDTRFAKDKRPYRTDITAILPCAGRPKEEAAGFAFKVTPDGGTLIGGAYMPGPVALKAIRAALATDHVAFGRLISARALVRRCGALRGDALSRGPKGVPPDHPAIDVLRRTQWYFERPYTVAELTGPGLLRSITETITVMLPMVIWLDRALDR
jgi:uncharacterized protein (TIGR02453 family)